MEMNRSPSHIRTIFPLPDDSHLQSLPLQNIYLQSPIKALYFQRCLRESTPTESLPDSGIFGTPTDFTPTQFRRSIPLFSPIKTQQTIYFHPGLPAAEEPVIVEPEVEEEMVLVKQEVIIEIEDEENVEPSPAKRGRFEVQQVIDPGLQEDGFLRSPHPPPPLQQLHAPRAELQRPGKWELRN